MATARIVRGSDGDVYDRTWVFKHGSRTGAPFDFMIGEVAYLTGPPLHVHEVQYDTFYVLEGVLAVQVGDEMIDLAAGDFASVPPGVAHTFDNVRRDQPPVKVRNFMTPGGLDAFIVTLNELGPAAEPAQVAAAGEKMASAFIGPTIGQRLGLVR